MANWSYDGVILPDFPTDFGAYTDQYGYRAIVWEEKRQRWFALASGSPFVVQRGRDNLLGLFATNYHGQYYHPVDGTAWIFVGNHYGSGDMLYFGDEHGYKMVWANHDIINKVDNSVFWTVSDPVSPGSVITRLEVNAEELRLNRGDSVQITAKVTGTGIYSSRLNWTLSRNDANGGTTLTQDGLLTVGETEYSSVFTVTVASRQDPSVRKTITVTVADYRSKLRLGIVTDLYDFNGTVLAEFPADFGVYSDSYTYRAIVWEEKRQRWYALASSGKFVVQRGRDNLLGLFATDYHGQQYYPLDGTAWIFVGNHYNSGDMLYFGDENGYQMVWANHDIINKVDNSVFFEKSNPVRLCTPVTTPDGIVYQVIGSAVWLDGTCVHLNTTDPVYTIRVWLYRMEDGLSTALPPTWISDVFSGPDWSQRLSFPRLEPYTQYGIHAVIFVEDEATDHFWDGTFTTAETLGIDFTLTRLYVENPEHTDTTADFDIGWVNLPMVASPNHVQYFISADLSDGTNQTTYLCSSTAPEDGVHWFSFDDLIPGKKYTMTARLLYNTTGEFFGFTDSGVFVTYEFVTLGGGYDRDSFLLGLASGLGATAATKSDAEYNSWMQGYLVGSALVAALQGNGADVDIGGIQSADGYTLLDLSGVYLIPKDGE